MCLDFSRPDFPLLKDSALAFAIVLISLLLFEFAFGSYNMFSNALMVIPVAFHEIGHLFFGFIVSPILSLIPPLSYLAEPIHFLGAFLSNGLFGILILLLGLYSYSTVVSAKLAKQFRYSAFSFLFIAYLNLLMVPYTLTHLQHVVGKGADFTMASFLLSVSLDQLLSTLWAFNWAVLAIAFFLNFFFIFRKR